MRNTTLCWYLILSVFRFQSVFANSFSVFRRVSTKWHFHLLWDALGLRFFWDIDMIRLIDWIAVISHNVSNISEGNSIIKYRRFIINWSLKLKLERSKWDLYHKLTSIIQFLICRMVFFTVYSHSILKNSSLALQFFSRFSNLIITLQFSL
jgi:hypothetical protein